MKMREWAANGFVAVNIEYHGDADGRFGSHSYPGTVWGTKADGRGAVARGPVRHPLSG